jgi:predicted NAD/FAD-binding protein
MHVLNVHSDPAATGRRIAVVGTGISGLVSARLLQQRHEVTVFEAGDHAGGHTVTTEVEAPEGPLAVDAGFIVYNEDNYPNFVRLLRQLEVPTQPTSMSFSVACERTGLEYAGASLDALFAQRANLFRVRFYGLLVEIARFNRLARRAVAVSPAGTLREFLDTHRLSRSLAELYLVPLTAAIWSADPARVLDTPARFILRFLENHQLLGATGHRRWRVVAGGSRRYVDALVRPLEDRVRLRTPVRRVRRADAGGVDVVTDSGIERFDEVVVATHSDQALALLEAPTRQEAEVLGAIPYQANRAVLHTDASLLPSRPRAWASWNYRVPREAGRPVAVTYNMTRLQGLSTTTQYCVSLNLDDEVDPATVIRRFSFTHPLFTQGAVAAQARHAEVSGADRIHYCGAYWGHGFHEDGVVSALAACRRFGVAL